MSEIVDTLASDLNRYRRLSTRLLERMREIATAATPGPWKRGKHGASVVCDPKHQLQIDGANEHAYYGGGLIAESIQSSNATFIAMFGPDMVLDLLALVLRATESELSTDEARVVRTWRVDLECTGPRVAELAYAAWGYGDGTPDCGRLYCEQAAKLLGEDPSAPPWNL